jgi:hypothetical protein
LRQLHGLMQLPLVHQHRVRLQLPRARIARHQPRRIGLHNLLLLPLTQYTLVLPIPPKTSRLRHQVSASNMIKLSTAAPQPTGTLKLRQHLH